MPIFVIERKETTSRLIHIKAETIEAAEKFADYTAENWTSETFKIGLITLNSGLEEDTIPARIIDVSKEYCNDITEVIAVE